MRKAYGCGIVNGVGNGRFDPNAYTTREQIATMAGRTIQVIAPDKAAKYINISMFKDDDQVADYAKPYVKFMAQNGYIKGSDGYFKPKENCTREQAVLIMTRIFESLGGTAPPSQATNPSTPANGSNSSSGKESATNSRTIIGTWSTNDNLGDYFDSGTGRYRATGFYVLAFIFREDGTFTRIFITEMGNTQTEGRYKFVDGEPERYPGGRKILVYDQKYKFYNSKGELGEVGEEDDEVFEVRYNPEDDTLSTNWLAGNRLKRIN